MRCNVPSYLTRRGRGFTQAQFRRFLWDVSAPLADDIISNEKHVQFDVICFRKSSAEMRIVVALHVNGAFLHRGDCKTIVLTGKIR